MATVVSVCVCVLFAVGMSFVDSADTVYEALGRQPELSKFQEMVNRDPVLRKMLQTWSVTVFAPTNDALQLANEWIVGRENKVVSYHVLSTVTEKRFFPYTTPTTLTGSPPVYLAVKDAPGFKKEYFVNNARIMRTEEFTSLEGSRQVLYVVDEALQPFSPSGSSLPPTAFDLLDRPDAYEIREPLSAFAHRVRSEGVQELFQREGNHTFFIPVGAGSGHAFNRQQEIDKWVIRGHVIPRRVLFTRLVQFESFPSEAYGDGIKVELSVINESNSVGNAYTLYAQSHTVESNYLHKKGVVMSKILRPNIPVRNGVVHLIESPLMIVDLTVWRFLQSERDRPLSDFLELVNYAPDFKELLMSNVEKTLFAPSNDAIRQLPPDAVRMLKTNITAVTNLLKLHLVLKSVSTDDVLFGRHKESLSADNRNSLYFRVTGDERNKTLTVDGAGVSATAVQPDIGATDGMVHVIDRLLGVPYQTLQLKLHADPDLSISSDMAQQDGWGAALGAAEKRFTLFVPSDAAWAELRRHMPTEYKQLAMGSFPYHVHKILDRHLVVNRELRASDLERLSDIQMVHGHFKILHEPNPAGKIQLEWEGIHANIVRPDVQAVNGVIHVIDRVMMKRRDLTKSGSAHIRISTPIVPALLLALAAIFY